MRVYEIARELNIPSKEVKMYLEYIGQPVKSASSSVEDLFGEIVIERITKRTPCILKIDFQFILLLYENFCNRRKWSCWKFYN